MTVPAETLQPLPWDADIASAAALIARFDPGRDLARAAAGPPAGRRGLARLAGVSAATASFHLAKLLEGGLITVIRQGRHRYYRLAGHEVAAALEALGLISPGLPVRSLRQSREAAALAEARTRHDHLAGRAGVEVLDGLLRQGLLEEKSGRTDRGDTSSHRFEVTGAGARELGSFGLNLKQIRRSRRQFAGTCIDWNPNPQRRRHLNGALAAAITSRMFELGWIERVPRSHRRRSVRVTPVGMEGLASTFGADLL